MKRNDLIYVRSIVMTTIDPLRFCWPTRFLSALCPPPPPPTMMLFRMLFDGTMNRQRSTGSPRKPGRRGSKATNHHQGQARDPPALREEKKDGTQRHFARATPRKATLEPGQPRAEALVDTIPPSVHLVETNCFYFRGMKVRLHHR
jgi:hypothetical protein